MSGRVIYGVQAPGSVRFAWWEEEVVGAAAASATPRSEQGVVLPPASPTDWEGLKKSLSRDFC